ncbi:uncharacterized protein LOC107469683 [Arachis duranensis]|uniref:Uncharacterized protein LOC107469683 n=1 Tax=Arachis duranensis TaxID=130453 RepID=A0A6P4C5T2_ARADU|nr:uncharacterized protein LOC107469683 [Arachis duranensis]
MPITTVQIKGIIHKEATIIKGVTTIKVGKTIPTKDRGTTTTKEVETIVGTKGGIITTNKTGACVSIMPLSVYDTLKLPPLKRSAAHFVLADKSIISVVGIAEDVLVSIKGLFFPIDFHILEMPPSDTGRTSSILLGRLFLKTSQFKLDAFSGTYSFEINGRAVSFSLDEAMRHPPEDHSIFRCDLIDNVVAEVHHNGFDEKSMIQGPSVGNSHECKEDTLPPPVLLDD